VENAAVRLSTYDLNNDDGSIKLFPNPVNAGMLNISSGKQQIQNLEIFSMFGQLVRSIDDQGAKQQIDVSALPVGTYFVRITVNEDVISKSFIKEN